MLAKLFIYLCDLPVENMQKMVQYHTSLVFIGLLFFSNMLSTLVAQTGLDDFYEACQPY